LQKRHLQKRYMAFTKTHSTWQRSKRSVARLQLRPLTEQLGDETKEKGAKSATITKMANAVGS